MSELWVGDEKEGSETSLRDSFHDVPSGSPTPASLFMFRLSAYPSIRLRIQRPNLHLSKSVDINIGGLHPSLEGRGQVAASLGVEGPKIDYHMYGKTNYLPFHASCRCL
jgi:hypothetical protein